MEPDPAVFAGVFYDLLCYQALQGPGNHAHTNHHRGAELAVTKHQRCCMQFIQRRIHLLPVEFAFLCQPDVSAHFFKQLHTTQFVFQIVDGAAQGGLRNSQPGCGNGIMLHLSKNREIAQYVVVHMGISKSIV